MEKLPEISRIMFVGFDELKSRNETYENEKDNTIQYNDEGDIVLSIESDINK